MHETVSDTSSAPMQANTLTIDFVGDVVVLEPGEQLTFGRDAELRLDEDDDRYLHRAAGKFLWYREMWWLENLGELIELVLRDSDGADEKWVRPAQPPEPLTRLAGIVWLSSGMRQYQLEYSQARNPAPPRSLVPVSLGEKTETFGMVELGEGQRLLLTVLAEGRLRGDRSLSALPTNEEAARRLGWTDRAFEHKLTGLCSLFTGKNVTGLVAPQGHKATRRREILVDHVLKQKMITPADLDRLERLK